MTLFRLVRTELARLTSTRLGTLALLALMIVPVIYGGLYLWGNKDPYGNLNQVPAALVVSDTGTTVDGDAENFGRDAADELLDGNRFDWHETTAADAARGIADGTYDFALGFPAGFSADLASTGGPDARAARLDLTTSDTNSYLSTTLAKQAAEAVRVSVAKNVGEEAARTLLDGVDSLRGGLVDAEEGAAKLASGATSAASGASSLARGTGQLAAGAQRLDAGLGTLDSAASRLPASASALASGAAKVAAGATAATSATTTLKGYADQAAALTPAVRAQVAQELSAAGVSDAEAAPILARLDALGSLTTGLDGGLAQLDGSLPTLAGGASAVSSGAQKLSASAPKLADAVHTAATGAGTLASGATDAAAGASSLATGLDRLADGTRTLDRSLDDGIAQVDPTTAAERATSAALIADPADVTQTAETEAQNYGAGLAPFFLSLAAWIGIYALFLLVRPLSKRALTAVRRPVTTALAGWATPAVLGVVQMVALFAVVVFGLGLRVADPVALLGFLAVVSITYAAIVLALNVLFGSVGQFLGLVLMIVQLVTAGGTFPWQTLPGPLAALHQALPMSHAVDGIRQLMYGGSFATVGSALGVLAAWLVGSLAVATFGAWRQGQQQSLRMLRPSPIGA